MNATLHAQILTLRKYQAWRTGKDARTIGEVGIKPTAVTIALDAVLEVAESCLRDATKPAEPSGYAYRYRDVSGGTVLRFNSGEEVNGARPVEAVPYWFAPPNATTVTCQLYGHPLKTCAECNHELACSAKPVSVPSDAEIMAELRAGGALATSNSVAAVRVILAKHGHATLPYNLDTDPAGVRALAADAIRGAIGFGIQGTSPPPARHWLTEFWEAGRAMARHCHTASDAAIAFADGFGKGKTSAGEDAARYRTLRAMPPGIRVQVHVGEGEWEDVCSGDELDRVVRNVMDAP